MYTIALAICLSVGCLFLEETQPTLFETREECVLAALSAATQLQQSMKDDVRIGYRCVLTNRNNI